MPKNSINEQSIFEVARKIDDQKARSEYVDQMCSGDLAVKERVQKLLQANEENGSFLESPPSELGPEMTLDHSSSAVKPGTMIGPYKIREQIGEGGFGTVYVAEQKHPVSRKVALKVIKPGMDSKEIVARFEAERQALAMMDHFNIARVLDAGATESGRPYFAMELVHGVPLTEFCDDQKLTNRQRLELFIDVCRAVQHAHQKGIIHRDLKPSNIMVTMHDDRPVPKVIDFGVSKAISHKLTDNTVYTAYGQMVGTPLYMSPEQAQMSGLDIDTRSDIYSLGVLLYELLAGVTPFDKEKFKNAGFDEMRRIIREDEPPRPSDRASTLNAELRSTIASRRSADDRGFGQSMRGELDWIVMKAMEKDRNRRYESASNLADDVERYLHDEPVLACPPSVVYKARKFARRNIVLIGTGSLVAAAMVVGLSLATWQAIRATRAKKTALLERDRATQAEGKLRISLKDVEEHSQREKMALAKETKDRLKINQQLSDALTNVGQLQSKAEHAGFDNTAAWAAVSQAVERTKTLLESELISEVLQNRAAETLALLDKTDRDRSMIQLLEDIRLEQAATNSEQGRFTVQEAIPKYQAAFVSYGLDENAVSSDKAAKQIQTCSPVMRKSLIAGLDEWCRLETAHTKKSDEKDKRCNWIAAVISETDINPWRNQARQAMQEKDYETLRSLAKTVELSKQTPQILVTVAKSLARNSKDKPAAIEMLKRARNEYPDDFWVNSGLGRMYGKTDPPQYEKSIRCFMAAAIHPNSGCPWLNLGFYLGKNGEVEAAIDSYRKAISVQPNFIKAYTNLGNSLSKQGKHDEAIVMYRKAIELYPYYSGTHNNLGTVLLRQDKLDEAIVQFRKAIEIDPKYVKAHNNLGVVLLRQDKPDEAIVQYRKAIELDPKDILALRLLGSVFLTQKRLDEAALQFKKMIEIDPDLVEAHNDLGAVLSMQGKLDEANAQVRKVIELDPKSAAAHLRLGIILSAQKKPDEAIVAYKKAIELDPKNAPAHANLGNALLQQNKSDEAVAVYAKLLGLVPNNPVLLNSVAWPLVTIPDEKGQYPQAEQAVEWARQACELSKNDAALLNTLGVAYYRTGQWRQALETLQLSVKEVDVAENWLFIAMAHWQLNDQAQARTWYDKSLAWREKNKASVELAGFFAEVEQLLDIKKEGDKPEKAEVETKVKRTADNPGSGK